MKNETEAARTEKAWEQLVGALQVLTEGRVIRWERYPEDDLCLKAQISLQLDEQIEEGVTSKPIGHILAVWNTGLWDDEGNVFSFDSMGPDVEALFAAASAASA